MTWISLVCLLVLSSSAFGQSGYGGAYGGASVQQVPKLLQMMRERPIQRPLVSSLPVASQGYGQQQLQQPSTIDWSSALLQQQLQQQQQQQQDILSQQKLQGGAYGTTLTQKTLPAQNYGQINQGYGQVNQGYGQVSQGYGALPLVPQFEQQQQVQQVQLTAADLLCRGQKPETIIPIENNRKFVVCLDDSKGVEQQCPKGLVYHPTSNRCERKLGPLENVCASQPCLNGGQCTPTDSWYQCQCAPGFDGKTCELDARVCQTQQPCGQAADTKCQSFRWGAALQYICIFQDGVAYGLNANQALPSPCQGVDGPHALAVSNNGFIMCDGERMYVESCPGGTIWDDINKACVWPDMQAAPQLDQQIVGYGQSSYGYGQQQKTISQPTYGSQSLVRSFEQPQQIQSSYGAQLIAPQQFQQPRHIHHQHHSKIIRPQQQLDQTYQGQSYGAQVIAPQQVSAYGGQSIVSQLEQPQQIQSSYGAQLMAPQQFQQPKHIHHQHHSKIIRPQQQLDQSNQGQSYGAQLIAPQQVSAYGGQSIVSQLEQPKQVSAYGSQLNLQPQQVSSYGGQSVVSQLEQPKQVSAYSSQLNLQPQQVSSYGGQSIVSQLEQPKQVSLNGAQITAQQPGLATSYSSQQQPQQTQQDEVVSVKQSSGY